MVCITKQEADIKRQKLQGIIHLMPKIELATAIIKEILSHHSKPVITFSGGKDSLVVLEMVRSVRPDTPALFANTGNEYPETVRYIKSFENIIVVEPEMPIKLKDGTTKIIRGNKVFWACVHKYGLPKSKSKAKRHGNACCFWLKEKPLRKREQEDRNDVVFDGLTSAESRQRMMTLKRMGYYYYNKQDKAYRCHPIYNWTEQDVWDYILFKGLRYNPIYDIGIPRCGCRFCTAYLNWKQITALYNEKDTQLLSRKQGHKLLTDFK